MVINKRGSGMGVKKRRTEDDRSNQVEISGDNDNDCKFTACVMLSWQFCGESEENMEIFS